jgi:hypothetical protein
VFASMELGHSVGLSKEMADALEKLPKRLQSTIFQVEVMKTKIVETYHHKTCEDPFLRELFQEKIEKLGLLIERNLQECYYSGNSIKVLDFFICAFTCIMNLHEVIDDLVSDNTDGLISTNLRAVFKSGTNRDYITNVERIIERSGAMNFIKTEKFLKSAKSKMIERAKSNMIKRMNSQPDNPCNPISRMTSRAGLPNDHISRANSRLVLSDNSFAKVDSHSFLPDILIEKSNSRSVLPDIPTAKGNSSIEIQSTNSMQVLKKHRSRYSLLPRI